MRIKKELLEVALVIGIGVLFIFAICLNVKQYDKKHPISINQVESFSNDL